MGLWYVHCVRPLTHITKENTITTTNGKGTTPKTTNQALAKEWCEAEGNVLDKVINIYLEFVRSGATDKLAWATKYENDNKGTKYDRYTAGSVRVNLSHIEWAENNIIGGARACSSIAHIIKTKSAGKKPTPKDTTTYKVRTISGSDLVRELVANGVERKAALVIAKNMRFV